MWGVGSSLEWLKRIEVAIKTGPEDWPEDWRGHLHGLDVDGGAVLHVLTRSGATAVAVYWAVCAEVPTWVGSRLAAGQARMHGWQQRRT